MRIESATRGGRVAVDADQKSKPVQLLSTPSPGLSLPNTLLDVQ
jgi:hypothetical protein